MSDNEVAPPQPTPAIQDASPHDTIRILLATDNHIGYNERDPVRGQDSINTFEEILQLAVDFILLAGDLFHENKPSRECLYRVMALLREYTMGDKPVQVELLSDPNEGKADSFSFPAVNYEDPNFNVGIPVFSIHGNHDDPQGTGVDGALCALDVLSVSGLINYFGKIDLPASDSNAHNTGIAVRPILLRKGNTYLGMYGVGNVKDQRMHFELRSNRVRMYMPKNKDDWFNLLLVHQNRVKHGPQEFVPEGMFDDSIGLVVWGHEHDCRILPEPVAGKNYYITQPGSSVATSLADGEAIPKHVALLEIQGKEFQLTPIPLRTVRPFFIEDIHLISASEEEGFDISDNIEIAKFLKSRVEALIQKAQEQWNERNAQALAAGEPESQPMLPLIRLKVDATGVTATFNPIRFGQEFQNRIANPRDVLTFHRKKAGTGAGSRSGKVAIDQPELSIDDPELSVQEKLAKVRVQTLVQEYLSAQELQLLGESGMSDAIQMFVEKDDIHAIEQHVEKSLAALMKGVARQDDMDEDDLEELLAKAKEQHDQQYLEARAKVKKNKGKSKAVPEPEPESDDSMRMDVDPHGGGSDFDESDVPPPTTTKKRATGTTRGAKAGTTGAGRGRKASATTTRTTAAAKKATGTGRGRGKKAVVQESDDDDAEVIDVNVSDDEDDEDEEDEVVPVKSGKKTNRAAVLSQPAAKKAPAKKKTATRGANADATQSQLNFQPVARSSRAAATKARGRMVVDDDSD
ncbi:hypothetical protein NP233_g9002 [Leucocoprinus birnbaumii]|uniref:Double-strand break repair protein n=1 Tax=Leucocoprinus birnbaumii TaxID=56174 RepID=A0AAD5YT77_9AGAR|nr:hypothetical protein NP233_g9002 [Leucocoprinus birnbaumii]